MASWSDTDNGAIDDSELIVPSSLKAISPFLHVANEVEKENPRVAYLCRFHAFEEAHRMDPLSYGLGVRQFKTYLLQRLGREELETKPILAEKDGGELQKYYQLFYEKNIKEGQFTKKLEEMAKIYHTAKVLYDVLRMVVPPTKIENEIQRYAKDVEEKVEQYKRYNIPPFNADRVKPAIMELPENSAEEGKEKSSRIMASSSGTNNSPVDDSELVPSSLEGIALILRVANEVEKENPRVAYLCRLHAFEEASMTDPISSGRGVPEFMTYLIHRLEKDKLETEPILTESDHGEIQKYYQLFYEKNIKEGQYKKKPEEMAKIYQIANVLYDVVRMMVPSISIDHEIRGYAKDVKEKIEQYKHYNIPPLNADRVKPAIMEQPEVKPGISAASDHLCMCGKPATIWTSLTDANPGRRFYGCQKERADGCSYFHWEDNPLCHRTREAIPSLCGRNETSEAKQKTLEQQNLTMEIKLNELELKNKNLEIVNKDLKTKNKRLSLWVTIAWTIVVAHCVLRLNEYIEYC